MSPANAARTAIVMVCFSCWVAVCEEESIDSLVSQLASTTPGDFDYAALAAKIKAKGQGCVPILANAARSGKERSRGACARCLGEVGGEQAVKVLLQLLDEGQELDDVFIGLAHTGDKTAIDPMRTWLSADKKIEENTRKRLIICLGELGDEKVVPDLIELLRPSALPGHRYGANNALQLIAGVDFRQNRQTAAEWYTKKTGVAFSEVKFDPIHLMTQGKEDHGIPGDSDLLSAEVNIDADLLRLTFHLREQADEKTVVYRVWMRFVDSGKRRTLVTANRGPLPEEDARSNPINIIGVDEIMPGGGMSLIRLVPRGWKNDQEQRTVSLLLPRGSGIEKVDGKSNFTFQCIREGKVLDALELVPKGIEDPPLAPPAKVCPTELISNSFPS